MNLNLLTRTGNHPRVVKFDRILGYGTVLLMWLAYTLLFALYLQEPWPSILGFLPGVIGLMALLAMGSTLKDCYLRFARISLPGFIVYLGLFLLMIPVIATGLETGWAGINWLIVLVYAPASGIAQELYFRSALLPLLERIFAGQARFTRIINALLFALFHTGMFLVAPAWVAFSAMLVTFVTGLGWGWQVQRDQTVIWAMLHHSLLQVILRLFVWA